MAAARAGTPPAPGTPRHAGKEKDVAAYKTFDKIAQRQEDIAAREALREARAIGLTRKLLKLAEKEEQQKRDREAEQSRRQYEQNARLCRAHADAENQDKQNERLIRNQIFQNMLAKRQIKMGLPVEVTKDSGAYEIECKASGLSWPNLADETTPRDTKLGLKGTIDKVDFKRGLAKVTGEVKWVPIRALVGFQAWTPETSDKELKKQGIIAEREKSLQLKREHSELDLERRRKDQEAKEEEAKNRIREEMEMREQRLGDLRKEQDNDRSEKSKPLTLKMEKAQERRRAEGRRLRQENLEKASERDEATREAEQRRQQLIEKESQRRHARTKTQDEKVAKMREDAEALEKERRRKMQEKDEALAREVAEKAAKAAGLDRIRIERTRHDPEATESSPASARMTGMVGGASASRQRDEAADLEPQYGGNKAKVQDLAKTKKEYIERLDKLHEARQKALVTKRFKSLADGAKEADDDAIARRMRLLHNMYIDKTPREAPKLDTPRGDEGRTPRMQPGSRKQTCGLCEKEFLAEHLVGSLPSRTAERLRHKASTGLPPPTSRRELAKQRTNHEASVETLGMASVDTGTSGPSLSGLYDQVVRVCAPCWHFARIASA